MVSRQMSFGGLIRPSIDRRALDFDGSESYLTNLVG